MRKKANSNFLSTHHLLDIYDLTHIRYSTMVLILLEVLEKFQSNNLKYESFIELLNYTLQIELHMNSFNFKYKNHEKEI